MEQRPQQQQYPQHHHAQQQPLQGRQRSKSTFSFKSQNSHASDPNRLEKKTSESSHARKTSDSYKPHLNTTGKADPNAAMNESQPSTSQCFLCLAVAAAIVVVVVASRSHR